MSHDNERDLKDIGYRGIQLVEVYFFEILRCYLIAKLQ